MNSKHSIKKRIIDIDYEKNKLSWIYYIPLLLIAGFVPLIVHGKYIDLTGTTQALFWTGQNQLLDFFSYWKSRWVIFLTAIALIIYIFLYMSKKLPLKKEYKYYIPLGAYAFFVILSTIFSIDVSTALNGFMDMYQGMWVLLSYVTITFLIINFINSERDINLFLYAFIFLIIVEGVIGIGQYFGFDIFNTKFGNHLIIPSGIAVDGGLSFNFGKHTIYGTLFNTNFVGSFAALMLPMAVAFLIWSKGKKMKIIAGIALFLCLFTWIGCNSRAGYVGVAVSLFIGLLLIRKYIFKYWKFNVCLCLLVIICLIIFNNIFEIDIMSNLSKLNIVKEITKIKEYNKREDIFKIKSLDIDGNSVSIKTTYQDLNIKVDGEKLYFTDNENNILTMKETEDGFLTIDNPNQQYLKVGISKGYPGFTVSTYLERFGSLSFYIEEEGISLISGNNGRLIKPITADSFYIFDNLESLGSSRGYIWGRSISVISRYIIYGSGADNYIYAFPQDDIVAKMNSYLPATAVIDKPHNMYLQVAINTGLLSLLALIALWLIYIISSFKLYWKLNLNTLDIIIGKACLLSIIAYLITGLFNDHIVSVSPLFWTILGLGIAVNTHVRRKNIQ